MRLNLLRSDACAQRSRPPAARRCGTYPIPGRVTSTPTPSRHPSTRSLNASLGNPDRRPPAACDAGQARACGRRHATRVRWRSPNTPPTRNLPPAATPCPPFLRRLGQVKSCYAAPDRALWRWIYYPSEVPRPACGPARRRRKSTLDPCHRPLHTRARAVESPIGHWEDRSSRIVFGTDVRRAWHSPLTG